MMFTIAWFSVSENTRLYACCLSSHQLPKLSGNPVIVRTSTPLSNWVELKRKLLGTDQCDYLMLYQELKLKYKDYN